MEATTYCAVMAPQQVLTLFQQELVRQTGIPMEMLAMNVQQATQYFTTATAEDVLILEWCDFLNPASIRTLTPEQVKLWNALAICYTEQMQLAGNQLALEELVDHTTSQIARDARMMMVAQSAAFETVVSNEPYAIGIKLLPFFSITPQPNMA